MTGVLACVLAGLAADPAEPLDSFQIHPDFQIERVAAEPLVFDPVDLEFDEHGRAFVVEMPGYPYPTDPGRVVSLDDTDDDGVYDRRTVFAEGFPVADSLLPWNGGWLVASPPDLVFLKDTDGDGAADHREVVLTGFAAGNPQHNFCGLTWGLDNWIYGANGGNGGSVYRPGDRENAVRLRREDFRIDPKTWRIERAGESTGGFELGYDDWGNLFGTHNLTHIQHLVFPSRYIAALPPRENGTLVNISDHDEGVTARIFPIGVQETRVNHPEQSGYFSGACGITYYGGGAFPDAFNGNVFICDVVLNLVHRDVLTPQGATFAASRPRERVEFLASTDRSFRPVNMTAGPDGALYLLDMHRAVIEHPEWIPDELERAMDLDAGKDKGRIYRITPKTGTPNYRWRFPHDHQETVVDSLHHPNKWIRDTAQRLLVEWNDPTFVKRLQAMFTLTTGPLARLHSMWTLEGLDSLSDDLLLRAVSDPDPGVREHAVRIAESRLDTDTIRKSVAALANDPHPRVRLQTALSLGIGPQDDTAQKALFEIARQDIADPWARLALAGALAREPGENVLAVLNEREVTELPGTANLVSILARTTGEENPEKLVEVLSALSNATVPDPVRAAALDGLAESRSSAEGAAIDPSIVAPALRAFVDHPDSEVMLAAWSLADSLGVPKSHTQLQALKAAQLQAADTSVSTADRLDAIEILAFAEFEDRAEALYALLDAREPGELQRAALTQLAGERNPEVGARLIAMWDELGPQALAPASNILLYDRGNHDQLLTALEDGAIALGQMNFHLERRRALLRSRDPEIRRRAEALFTDAGVVTRKEAMQRMQPALRISGNPGKGSKIFEERCAVCHKIGETGADFGPNLTDIFRKSHETLLHDIVDPNAAVDTQYVSYVVETKDGQIVTGIVSAETADAVTIRDATGKVTVFPKADIAEMYSQGLSLMPEELESDLDPEAMADLLAYLAEPR